MNIRTWIFGFEISAALVFLFLLIRSKILFAPEDVAIFRMLTSVVLGITLAYIIVNYSAVASDQPVRANTSIALIAWIYATALGCATAMVLQLRYAIWKLDPKYQQAHPNRFHITK